MKKKMLNSFGNVDFFPYMRDSMRMWIKKEICGKKTCVFLMAFKTVYKGILPNIK